MTIPTITHQLNKIYAFQFAIIFKNVEPPPFRGSIKFALALSAIAIQGQHPHFLSKVPIVAPFLGADYAF